MPASPVVWPAWLRHGDASCFSGAAVWLSALTRGSSLTPVNEDSNRRSLIRFCTLAGAKRYSVSRHASRHLHPSRLPQSVLRSPYHRLESRVIADRIEIWIGLRPV